MLDAARLHSARFLNYRRPPPPVRWSRRILVAIVVLTAAWLAYVNQVRVIGVGFIQAQEAIITSQFTGHIANLSVTCNDRVRQGDPIGVVDDPIRSATYRQELAELEATYRARQQTHIGRLAEAAARLEGARRHAAAKEQETRNATTLKAAMQQAAGRGESSLKEKMRVESAYNEAVDGLAAAEAEVAALEAASLRLKIEEDAQLTGFAERLDAQRRLVSLGEENVIRAPFDGVVTACPRMIGEIAHPGVAIIRLQRENAMRIMVWVASEDLPRIHAGMAAEVFLGESDRSFSGTVRKLPVEVGALPSRLRRYFWQNQTWQQYAPVEIIPDPGTGEMLYGNARVDAVIQLQKLPRRMADIFRPV